MGYGPTGQFGLDVQNKPRKQAAFLSKGYKGDRPRNGNFRLNVDEGKQRRNWAGWSRLHREKVWGPTLQFGKGRRAREKNWH